MDDILQEFLAESWENLSRLDTEIIELEKDPSDAGLLASIFRTIHTIKGTCGFIGLNRLNAVAHSAENVLGQMRDRRIEVTADGISLVLEAVDRIKEMLRAVEATGTEPESDDSDLIARLDGFAASGGSEPAQQGQQAAPPEPAAQAENHEPENSALEQVEQVEPTGPPSASAPEKQEAGNQAEAERPGQTASEEAGRPQGETSSSERRAAGSIADLSIRVNVDVLDSLMNLVGELVLTRNQLLQMIRGDEESRYAGPITQLNRVTTDLQEGVMKTRMQPIGSAWSKLPRIVRDLSQSTGKQVELEMSGAETELDRTVLDAIKDPLTHMVRNSVDHGIEPPEVRRAAGKPETGRVSLHAFHEGGHVIITIEDDGAGINVEKVKQKAVTLGLVSEAEAERLADHEILQFIFRPGFSTAEQVSTISGRGVGMDVVKTQIEKIGGTVDVSSSPGVGSTVRIKIPLTLAIISALVVESGGQPFAIPQLGVVELVRLAAEERHRIEAIHDKHVLRLRDRLLPLVHLDEVLGIPDTEEERDVNIVVVQVGEEQFGLIVSEVFDTEEIVVKPVSSLLKDIAIYQGTTILGDGRVIMILDVAGIAAQFGSVSSSAAAAETTETAEGQHAGDATSLLLFNAGDETKMAVPLSLVARLEEIPRGDIERTGDRLVVQYRGDLLPLIPVEGYHPPQEPDGTQSVIVFSDGTGSMGLMIGEVEDIASERLTIRRQSQRPGVLGTAIIKGRATDIIDTRYYLLQADPDWFLTHEKHATRRILVVDDSIFFRQLVSTALEAEGYSTVIVESARQAIELIEQGERFDLIVSDLDMPEMDGWQFVQWIRANVRNAPPVVAMTALSGEKHEARALSAGFDRFLQKFDTTQLVRLIEEVCLERAAPEEVSV